MPKRRVRIAPPRKNKEVSASTSLDVELAREVVALSGFGAEFKWAQFLRILCRDFVAAKKRAGAGGAGRARLAAAIKKTNDNPISISHVF